MEINPLTSMPRNFRLSTFIIRKTRAREIFVYEVARFYGEKLDEERARAKEKNRANSWLCWAIVWVWRRWWWGKREKHEKKSITICLTNTCDWEADWSEFRAWLLCTFGIIFRHRFNYMYMEEQMERYSRGHGRGRKAFAFVRRNVSCSYR